jgi:hypothetical protein
MTRKIAIVMSNSLNEFVDIDSNNYRIISSISNWEEVTDEEYQLLAQGQLTLNYRIFEQPLDTKKFIIETVSQCKEMCLKEKERKLAESKKRIEDEVARKKKKDETAKANKLKLFKKLQAELGDNPPTPDIPTSTPSIPTSTPINSISAPPST